MAEAISLPPSASSSAPSIGPIKNADNYYLNKVELISVSNEAIDIKPMIIEISLYQDIFRPVMTGDVMVNDAIGMINTLKIDGSEKIRITFSKSASTDVLFTSVEYKIIRIGERIKKNFNSEHYTIHFCSNELFLSEGQKVSKSYPGKKINDIVTDILTNYLKVPVKNQSVGITDGVYDFVIPYKKPFEAINFLATYARAPGTSTNNVYDFLFFERGDRKFVFQSLQTLYQSQSYGTYAFSAKNYFSPESSGGLVLGLRGIKAYSFLDTFDTLYGITTGAFANRVITIDPLTMQYYKSDFNYSKEFEKSKSLNKYPLQNLSLSSSYEAVLKVLTTNKNQEKAIGINDKPGAVAKDTYNEDRIRFRTAQIPLSQYTRMKLTVAGDPNLNVGSVIEILLPKLNEDQTGGIDDYHSGRYLITAVRQIIDANMEYETVLEVAKNSFYKIDGN